MSARIFQHPMASLLLAATLFVLGIGAMDLIWGMSSALLLQADAAGNITYTGSRIDWAALIAAIIWISGFGAGIVGAIICLTRIYRLARGTTMDTSLMHELTNEEAYELNTWIAAEQSRFKG